MKAFLALIAPVLAGCALSGCATSPGGDTSDAAIGEETYLRYSGSPSDIEWRGGSGETLYLQDIRRDWFRVMVTPPCSLTGSFAITFRNRIPGRIERGDTIVSNRESCMINSIVRMAGPPPGKDRDDG